MKNDSKDDLRHTNSNKRSISSLQKERYFHRFVFFFKDISCYSKEHFGWDSKIKQCNSIHQKEINDHTPTFVRDSKPDNIIWMWQMILQFVFATFQCAAGQPSPNSHTWTVAMEASIWLRVWSFFFMLFKIVERGGATEIAWGRFMRRSSCCHFKKAKATLDYQYCSAQNTLHHKQQFQCSGTLYK